ncbi:ParA family protein [Acaryochloris marina]|uniref:ParA family protein n=1 Tax=Acaryochloris marina TaxID=155978 RepID=UPI0021C43ABD|nr:ParA family protein [Acaryochloris marina]BDM83082.1 cobyrinic acid a,c-diamide synthase [Acaryochloris marina MBIC10699]
MGKIISLVNEKGGSTKSTTCVHLATWLKNANYKVCVIDADPQKSSSVWIESLELDIPCTLMFSADDLIDKTGDLADEFDYIVIDSPGKTDEITRAILLVSDFALLPVPPAGLDLHPSQKTVRLIKQAQKVRGGLPKGALFINRAGKNTRLKDETKQALKDINEVDTLESIVHFKQVIIDSFGQGQTVFSMKGRAAKDAAREFNKLFTELLEIM